MTLRILAAGSMLHGARACAAALGNIEVATDHGHNIRNAVGRDAVDADVVLIPADMIMELQSEGLVRDPVPLGTVGIGGVVRLGSLMPKITIMTELRDAITAADAILLTHAPTGDHLMSVIENLGLTETVVTKLLRFDTSTALNVHLAGRSDNALGFGPETEIRSAKGVGWIGDVPPEIQIALPCAAAVLASTKAPDIAGAFLKFLQTDIAREIFRHSGFR